jgi:membrane-bound metal-dependent hydrolase YbcI (DUF457 family)
MTLTLRAGHFCIASSSVSFELVKILAFVRKHRGETHSCVVTAGAGARHSREA